VHNCQFDWGGRLLKSNEGVHKVNSTWYESKFELNGINLLDCETDKSIRDESRS
jgi:hypothetical protein